MRTVGRKRAESVPHRPLPVHVPVALRSSSMETRLTLPPVSTPDRRSRRNPHSPVIKHSITLAGNKTSISLENQFWHGLREIARRENSAVCALIEQIDTDRTRHNLSSAVRLYVLNYFKTRTSQQILPNARPELPANRTVAAS